MPSRLALKTHKKGWDEEFEVEKSTYAAMKDLQGIRIPKYYGELKYNGTRAILLSDIGGACIGDPAGAILGREEFRRMMNEALTDLARFGVLPDDIRLENFHLVDEPVSVRLFGVVLLHERRTKIDAAMGLSALFLLINRGVTNVNEAKLKILGNVPRGFQKKGVPNVNMKLLKAIAPEHPATIIVLIIEHIAISKSFGRVNHYVINPSQELVAIGLANLFGPFLGAYPATGSFSRTALKSKAGVRTPLAGIFTSIIVLLALYALTSVFFYIPMSSLAAVIMHAVIDLITRPNVVYEYWEVSPLDFFIFLAGVLMTIFTAGKAEHCKI
ncbi:sulfate permease II [Metarhizium rileyi]|uniref:Sulfate permease II n=1 Tax=Metarhizium rileyi (strain RCEF 4871) TaxID=1649241 RepID=A0A167CX42_METRR|nr:sulfate permease II [Metarhizium rileyi RCEF 4871]